MFLGKILLSVLSCLRMQQYIYFVSRSSYQWWNRKNEKKISDVNPPPITRKDENLSDNLVETGLCLLFKLFGCGCVYVPRWIVIMNKKEVVPMYSHHMNKVWIFWKFSANNSEVEFRVDNLFSLLSRRLFLVGKITRRREHLFLIKQQASSPHWIGSWKSFQDDICFQILVHIWNSFLYQNRVTITILHLIIGNTLRLRLNWGIWFGDLITWNPSKHHFNSNELVEFVIMDFKSLPKSFYTIATRVSSPKLWINAWSLVMQSYFIEW